ncbi:MAG: cation:proton antiporter subunit C [Halobacteriales archaeon]
MIEALEARFAFLVVTVLLGVGLYMAVASPSLVKKLIGVNLFQTAVFLFFIALAYVDGGSAPILTNPAPHASPLPQVIVLTAIVVGVAVTALGLALIIRIYHQYGSLRTDTVEEVRLRE